MMVVCTEDTAQSYIAQARSSGRSRPRRPRKGARIPPSYWIAISAGVRPLNQWQSTRRGSRWVAGRFVHRAEYRVRLDRFTFNDADDIRALFSDLIGKKVDDSFVLIPPFYTTGGAEITVGRNVFINQNCTL